MLHSLSHRLWPALAFWCFVLSICFLPIGFGGNRSLPLGLAQGGLALSFLFLTFISAFTFTQSFPFQLRTAFLLIGIVVTWALIQICGLLPSEWAHPIWQEAEKALGQKLHASIALSPEQALNSLSRMVTAIAASFLAYALAQDTKYAKKLLRIMWYAGAAICFYGLIEYSGGNTHILWFPKWAYKNDLTATFVNHSHFALFAGLVMLIGLALMLRSCLAWMYRPNQIFNKAAFQAWLLKKGLIYFVLLALVGLSIFLSHARAGLLITFFGLSVYAVLYLVRQKILSVKWSIITLAFALVTGGIILFHTSPGFAALFFDASSQQRWHVYHLTIMDNPILGYGMDCFQTIFRFYQPAAFITFNHAHSDILEAFLDLGVPAALLLAAALTFLMHMLWQGIKARHLHVHFPLIAFVATLMVLMHASIDFSLHIPGITLFWMTLLGIGLAQYQRNNALRHNAF